MNLPNEHPLHRGGSGGGGTQAAKQIDDLQKTITMAEIAKAAGVSQGAISSLLNDRDYGIRVSQITRSRVFRVCRELGYLPNDLRAVVRMYPELGDFSLLLSSKFEAGVREPFAARITAAAMDAVPDAAHSLTLGCYDENADYLASSQPLPHPVRSGVCSKFLTFGPANPRLHEALFRRGLSVVNLGSESHGAGVLNIIPDYAQASQLAIEHLVALGHEHLGIVSGPFGATDAKTLELNRGVRLACDQLKIPTEGQTIVSGDLSDHAGHAALEDLLTRRPKPTAIFCMSDAAAIGVLAEAQARGLRVPEDLSVIGCSDDLAAQWMQPRLTTIHIPAEEMAELGIREIDRLVTAPPPAASQTTVLPVRLIERNSCAPLRS